MTHAPKDTPTQPQSTQGRSTLSAPMLIFLTGLDTTWRIFAPTLGGTFLGIGIDYLLNIAPIATIVCLIAGTVASVLLIAKQLRDVRKPLK